LKIKTFEIVVDVVMTVALILVYCNKYLTIAFHEVAGLAIFGILIVHCISKYKWIGKVTKKFFSKKLPAKTRFSYCLSVLLLISFILVIASGVHQSQFLFEVSKAKAEAFWIIHSGFARVCLVLTIIHLVLQRNYIKAFFKKIATRKNSTP
jgi:cytochrome bd-type quinol oxidase subunit 1